MPRAEFATQETWHDYEGAKAAIDAIVPMQSTRAELRAAGIDPRTNAAVTIVNGLRHQLRFAAGARSRSRISIREYAGA